MVLMRISSQFFVFALAILSLPKSFAGAESCETGNIAESIRSEALHFDRFAEKLADFRISISQMPEGEQKSNALREFSRKMIEFDEVVGSSEQAKSFVQKALKTKNISGTKNSDLKEQEARNQKQKEEETFLLNPWQEIKRDRFAGGRTSYLEFSSDNQLLFVGNSVGRAKIFDFTKRQETEVPVYHHGDIKIAKFAPDRSKLLVADMKDQINMVDLQTMKNIPVPFKENESLVSMLVSPDSSKLITVSRHQPNDNPSAVRIWDLNSLHSSPEIYAHNWAVRQAEISKDGNYLITLSEDYGQTKKTWEQMRIYHLKSGQLIDVPVLDHSIHRFLISPDNQKLAIFYTGGRAQFFELPSLTELKTHSWKETPVYFPVFTPEGSHLIGFSKNTVRVMDMKTMTDQSIPLNSFVSNITTSKMSFDGTKIVFTEFGKLMMVDLIQKTTIALPNSSQQSLSNLHLTPDNATLFAVTDKQRFQMLDLTTNAEVAHRFSHFDGVENSVMASDGSKIATSDTTGGMTIWFRDARGAKQWK